jgi:hypothetical protein
VAGGGSFLHIPSRDRPIVHVFETSTDRRYPCVVLLIADEIRFSGSSNREGSYICGVMIHEVQKEGVSI